jgi:hypothetical protein
MAIRPARDGKEAAGLYGGRDAHRRARLLAVPLRPGTGWS